MKSASHILGLASICLLGLNVQADSVYDLQQLNYEQLANETIQWNYQTNTSVELKSSECSGPGFQEMKGFSQIRMLFTTFDYRQKFREENDFNFGFQIKCGKNIYEPNWMKIHIPKLNYSIPYTSVVIKAKQCDNKKHIKKIRFETRLGDESPSTFGIGSKDDGWRTLSPAPKCASITNFKTVFWPEIPTTW